MEDKKEDLLKRDYTIYTSENKKIGQYYLIFDFNDVKQLKKVQRIEKAFLANLKKNKLIYTCFDQILTDRSSLEMKF